MQEDLEFEASLSIHGVEEGQGWKKKVSLMCELLGFLLALQVLLYWCGKLQSLLIVSLV